jgi:hypothetical protein
MRYENEGEYWYAEKDGYADYFRDGGTGSASRHITTIDGEDRSFSGVGAGRASVVNGVGLGPCVDVKLTTSEEEFERQEGQSAAITLEAARDAAKLAGVKLRKESNDRGEVKWVPE